MIRTASSIKQAFLNAAKEADPKWEIGKPIPSGSLDGITRESVEANLRKSGQLHQWWKAVKN